MVPFIMDGVCSHSLSIGGDFVSIHLFFQNNDPLIRLDGNTYRPVQ